MGRSSFEIQEQAFRAAAGLMELVNDDGEIVDEAMYDQWLASLEEVFGELGDKLCALRAVEERIEREAEQLKIEGRRTMERAKQREKQAERVRGFMLMLLRANEQIQGSTRCDTPDGSFLSIQRRKSVSVVVADINQVPPKYLRVPDPKVDKASIKAAHAEGVTVPGVEVNEGTTEFVRKGS